ncbi:unnamed protein product [Malus baccata var. baccata]
MGEQNVAIGEEETGDEIKIYGHVVRSFKKLEAVVRLYQIKCLTRMPDKIFTTLLELIKRMLPERDCLPESCYKAKKLINDLGLTYVKINACPNDCMIYWKDTSDLTVCLVCDESRYKITNAKDRSRKRSQLRLCGSRSPGKKIDIYMRPLIDELNELWEVDTPTYDAYSNQSFTMKAAVLWTIRTLLDIEKSKDGLDARADLEVLNIRRSQHPRREGNRTFLPPALFTLKREEKTAFCKVLSTIRVPDGHSSNLSRCVHVNERKIHGLKNHDCHVLMQQLLPFAIRPVLPEAVTRVLLELSAIFRQLCSKKKFEEGFKQLNSRIALTLCQLEKIFPPVFFDIMAHLPVHVADEAALAGPVQYRWMYPIERYLQTLKCYVRNKGRPEGFIAEMSSLVAPVKAEMKMVLDVECLVDYQFDPKGCNMGSREKVELELNMNSRCHPNDTLISQDLHWLANYPSRVVSRYKSHIVHGFIFRIKFVDDKHKNQNCGVFVLENVPGAIGQVNCYGRVVDMFEVKYCGHAEAGDKGRSVICSNAARDLFDVLEDNDAIDDYAIPNLDDQILDHENFHTRVGLEETPFHELLPLSTQLASYANADDDTTDEDMK